jgi:hypothetical protein
VNAFRGLEDSSPATRRPTYVPKRRTKGSRRITTGTKDTARLIP